MNQISPDLKRGKIHLSYLDGLRGVASLFVLFFHLIQHQEGNLPVWITLPHKVLRYGFLGVPVFIVLSGYCLMLPVVRSQTGYIRGTLLDYFKRRARRIIPTYYASLIFCLLIALSIYVLEKFTNFQWHDLPWDWVSTKFSLIDVILHFLLIHNLGLGTQAYSISIPFWSVAVEWQIYFLFPLLLLPLWRRWGWLSVFGAAFVIGLAPIYLFNGAMKDTSFIFLVSFSIGMLAAEIGFSNQPHFLSVKKSYPWAFLTVIFTALCLLTEWEQLKIDRWVTFIFASMAAACLMIYCTKSICEGKRLPMILKIFESAPLVKLGAFSYSLYLTHGAVTTLVRHFLLNLQLTPIMFAVSIYFVSGGVALTFAYLFYIIFEKPFSSISQKNTRRYVQTKAH
ncbi:acyltransferase [Aetokthonos hydrillicola Thurmond2011]|jgi:peptidoglycan/LPS O-acetylase OafA/YrhL|uniref:Acyltransferase n=1 Tax=Aetokthonos hydrillicola Thurmond2011 TaxID=2712845 RepID=A0AAP5M8W4_9CYAN|nr:acyltransferase [Aetokthonos hydrillicola]MBO3458017.1 acyltransferase [Aetokthonos hydrillicola CCALA 1050]MBW4587149.1 acyltransferase [Aetokthonos hydrillicola CCALA 1050]MDR9899601.1 acyltransferase [Aetokthonos hydrillicola Thurmond2011]